MAKKVKQKYLTSEKHPPYREFPENQYGLGSALKSAFGSEGSAWGAVSSIGGGLANSSISGGMESGAGNIIGAAGQLASAIPGPWGAVTSVGLQAVGGLVNRAFGSKLNQENINAANQNIAQLNSFQSDAGSFDELSSNITNQPAVLGFNQSFIGKDGWFSHKASRKFKELKSKQEDAKAFVQNSINNNAENLDTTQGQNLLANFSSFGGSLDTQGSSFPLGFIEVNEGGTHEQNPNEGVQMGVDNQGVPNLVEEGEVIYNDYVFSNRLTVPEDMRKKYKLGKNPLTFAEASKKLAKEAEERPNDPISRRGLDAAIGALTQSQEEVRTIKQAREAQEQLASMTPEEQQMLMAQMQGGQEGGIMPQESSMVPQDEMMPQQPMMSYGGRLHAHGGNLFFDGGSEENVYWEDGTHGTIKGIGIIPGAAYQYLDAPSNRGITSSGKYAPVPDDMELLINSPQYRKDHPMEVKEWEEAHPNFGKTLDEIENKKTTSVGNTKMSSTWLRYAPVVGSALGLFQNILSKPDYSGAKTLEGYAQSLGNYSDIKSTPIGDYMTYRPLDRQYAINLLNAQNGATRRNVINTSGGNRGQAMAGILASDYNAGNNIGNLFRQAEESNQAQRERVATFNRGTNQFNAQQELTAAQANQNAQLRARSAMAGLYGQAAQMRDAVNAQRNAGISANLTNLFNNLGAIGKENMARNMVDGNKAWLYTIGADGSQTYKGVSDDSNAEKKARGGYLTISRKRKKGGKNG